MIRQHKHDVALIESLCFCFCMTWPKVAGIDFAMLYNNLKHLKIYLKFFEAGAIALSVPYGNALAWIYPLCPFPLISFQKSLSVNA